MNEAISRAADVSLHEILPPSLTDDDQLMALTDALDRQNNDFASDVDLHLPLLPNLDRLPERIVDLLAWQFHVDDYSTLDDIDVRREMVRNAIEQHRLQGTVAAVKTVLDRVFGAGNYNLVEWFESTGQPYTFVIYTERGFTDEVFPAAFMRRVVSALASAKNVRSWYTLAALRQSEMALNFGFVSHKVRFRKATI